MFDFVAGCFYLVCTHQKEIKKTKIMTNKKKKKKIKTKNYTKLYFD